MKYLKKSAGFLLLLALAFTLSACGASLQKPTGLENEEKIELVPEVPAVIIDEAAEEEGQPTVNEPDEPADPVEEMESEAANEETANVPPEDNESTIVEVEKPTVDPSKKPTAGGSAAKATEKQPDKKTEKPLTAKPPEKQPEKVEKPVEKPVTEKQLSKEETNPDPPVSEKPAASTVVYSIVISSSEVPLPPTEMEIEDGDTVLSALIAITKKHKVQMDYRGGRGATAYIEGIANVYEFDRGQGSGWMYRVNGIFPDRGAGAVPLQDGDRVEWLYTTDLGADLNADLKPFRRRKGD